MNASHDPIVRMTELCHTYRSDGMAVEALKNVSLTISKGEFVAIVGPSGSGKTTLLNLIGTLDQATSGQIEVLGHDLSRMTPAERARLRLNAIGFVFQAYNLMPVLNAWENVAFILELQGVKGDRRQRAIDLLRKLGLEELACRRPSQMSGGQQQRVAVARAIASDPPLVLADEPTANLDGKNAQHLLAMMQRLNREKGTTFIFSTHDQRILPFASRIIQIEDGTIVSDNVVEQSS